MLPCVLFDPHGARTHRSTIQSPRRKCILIDYQSLSRLAGYKNYEDFRAAHREWVNSALLKVPQVREPYWTQSVATGSKSYVEAVQKELSAMVIGRRILKTGKEYALGEQQATYNTLFDAKNRNIEQENLFNWKI